VPAPGGAPGDPAATSSATCGSSPVDGLLFPHARQVLRIQRRRRLYGAKKWSSQTLYAITDLPAEQATAAEIAA
jgi:hypothetical protein